MLASAEASPWTVKACDLYEVTGSGPAPAAAPAPVKPPVLATLNLRYTQSGNAALSFTNAYALGAA
jgi:hypothetical protein